MMIIKHQWRSTIQYELNSKNVSMKVNPTWNLSNLPIGMKMIFSILACTKFQDFEAEHVDKMLNFSLNYAEILKRNNDQTRLAQNEFQERIKQFTGTDLIEGFVEQKKTGVERPGKYPHALISE